MRRLEIETFSVTPVLQLAPSTGDRLIGALHPSSQ